MERVELVGPHLRVVVLPRHGADVHSIEDLRTGVDVLFKTAWGSHEGSPHLHAPDSVVGWSDHYLGGWQLLTPSAGDACSYQGVWHPYHGEACMSAWSCHPVERHARGIRVTMSTRLRRYPFRLERTVDVLDTEPAVEVTDVIVNEGRDPLPAMWTEHLVFGGPFVSPNCVIASGAASFSADRAYDGPFNPLAPGIDTGWPDAHDRDGRPLDLGQIPAITKPRQLLGYLRGFAEQAWFSLTDDTADLRLLATWSSAQMPFAWLWQELNASAGYPWYGTTRAIGIEPSSSMPAKGIAGAAAANTHRIIAAGASESVRVKLVLTPATAPARR